MLTHRASVVLLWVVWTVTSLRCSSSFIRKPIPPPVFSSLFLPIHLNPGYATFSFAAKRVSVKAHMFGFNSSMICRIDARLDLMPCALLYTSLISLFSGSFCVLVVFVFIFCLTTFEGLGSGGSKGGRGQGGGGVRTPPPEIP